MKIPLAKKRVYGGRYGAAPNYTSIFKKAANQDVLKLSQVNGMSPCEYRIKILPESIILSPKLLFVGLQILKYSANKGIL